MPLRIALCGAQGTGKTTLTTFIEELVKGELVEDSAHVVRLGSATRRTKELFEVDLNQGGNEWTQLYSSFIRRMWEMEHKLTPVLLSERWGIDEAAYQKWQLENIIKQAQGGILLPNGQNPAQNIQAQLAVNQAAFQVLLQQAAVEIEFWDFIYFMRPYPGAQITSEGVDEGIRSLDIQYQDDIDQNIAGIVEALGHLFPGKIKTPPREFSAAEEFFRSEVPEWRQSLVATPE